WPLQFQFPIISFSRAGDGYVPCSRFVSKRVLNASNDLAGQVSVTNVVELGGHSHGIELLSNKTSAQLSVQTGKTRALLALTSSLNRLSTVLVENHELLLLHFKDPTVGKLRPRNEKYL